MFADFTAHVRGRSDDPKARGDKSRAFRAYALWLTFPPMALLFIERPFGLIVAYGVLGSLFMPFLAGTLLWLLNSERVPREWRSHWVSNSLLAAAAILFAVLAGKELIGLIPL
jgi:Mn2+/Fe2+ NRAMP family transporter